MLAMGSDIPCRTSGLVVEHLASNLEILSSSPTKTLILHNTRLNSNPGGFALFLWKYSFFLPYFVFNLSQKYITFTIQWLVHAQRHKITTCATINFNLFLSQCDWPTPIGFSCTLVSTLCKEDEAEISSNIMLVCLHCDAHLNSMVMESCSNCRASWNCIWSMLCVSRCDCLLLLLLYFDWGGEWPHCLDLQYWGKWPFCDNGSIPFQMPCTSWEGGWNHSWYNCPWVCLLIGTYSSFVLWPPQHYHDPCLYCYSPIDAG